MRYVMMLLALPLFASNRTSQMRKDLTYLTKQLPHRSGVINLNIAADYIEKELKKGKIAVKQQTYTVDGRKYYNIIATLNPELKKVIVIGAHYDTVAETPGADDNGSGVAALLEIARKSAKIAKKIPYQVQFVAYTLEEPPYFDTRKMGSYIHARSLKKDGIKPVAVYVLEMLGYYLDLPDSQSYPVNSMKLLYPSTGNFIAAVSNLPSAPLANRFKKVMNRTTLPCEQLILPEITPGINLSDHRNYWGFHFPAIMITDTAFYRNENYHKATDTLETLDLDKMALIVDGMVRLLQIK